MQSKPSNADKRLVLIELNEVNFEIAQKYVESRGLTHFKALLAGARTRTSSESQYDELEPWIQWVSAHSGLSADEHGIRRLGDIVGKPVPQMFEQLESSGVKVGCVSAMNAENRLKDPAYFIPDPWTSTPSDGSFWSKALTSAIAQTVNDNAKGRISGKSAVALGLGLLRFARPRHWGLYAKLAFKSKGAPWRKALFLDLFLHDLHWSLLKRHRPGFSTLFLNAGAHIQHHYLFNSKAASSEAQRNPGWYVSGDDDPFAEMLEVYDRILGDYLSLQPHTDLIVATGLTQRPYDKLKYYYRLLDHVGFLKEVGIKHKAVMPRMTRDFLVEFDSVEDSQRAEQAFRSFRSADGVAIFGDIENRGLSLFLSMVYPHEMTADFVAVHEGGEVPLGRLVTFVAIKNGMHDANGFAFFSGGVSRHAPADGAHVKGLYRTVMDHFASA